jgi:molybdopterin-guanine dinucleotide biosynthesis protein A
VSAAAGQAVPAQQTVRVDLDGVVLAGGASRRFGGTDKTAEVVGGRTLLGRAVQALADAGAGTVVVVGPRLPDDVEVRCRVLLTREDPVGSGPAAGLAAGVALLHAPTVVVLAADLPGIDARTVRTLADGLSASRSDAFVATDGRGRAQWLTAAYRAEALREALGTALSARAAAGSEGTAARGPSLRSVVDLIRWTGAPPPADSGTLVDVDTPEDLARARLDDWARHLVDELGLGRATGDLAPSALVDLVLEVARDAAHTIARPAAPVTTFALGLAAGLAAGVDGDEPDDVGPAAADGAAERLAVLRARVDDLVRARGDG